MLIQVTAAQQRAPWCVNLDHFSLQLAGCCINCKPSKAPTWRPCMQELKVGSRTLDNMLRSGRFALVEGEPSPLKSAISAPAPMSPGPLTRRRSPVAHWPLSPNSGAFPSFQTWPPDVKSPRSHGGWPIPAFAFCKPRLGAF